MSVEGMARGYTLSEKGAEQLAAMLDEEHDWAPIAPPEDMGVMCDKCYQCKCCGPTTETCKGETDDLWFNENIVEGK